MKLFNCLRLIYGVCLLAVTQSTAMAIVTRTVGPFDFKFYGQGETGPGYFSEQNWTTEQMDDVAYAANAWDSVITNAHGRQLVVNMYWDDFNGGAQARSPLIRLGSSPNSMTHAEHIWRDGSDRPLILIGNSQYDINVLWLAAADDIGTYQWNFGSDMPTANQWDFRTIALHEIGHSLGFTGPQIVNDAWTFYPTRFYDNIVDANGNRPAYQSTGTPGNFDQNGPMYWTGLNANAAWGSPVPMMFNHVGLSVTNSIMAIPQDEGMSWNGHVQRQPNALDRAFLKDLGWAVVPEPSSLTLALVAVIALGMRSGRCD